MATGTIKTIINNRSTSGSTVFEQYGNVIVCQFNGQAVTNNAGVGLPNSSLYPKENVWATMVDETQKTTLRAGISTTGVMYLRSIETGNAITSATITGQIVYIV